MGDHKFQELLNLVDSFAKADDQIVAIGLCGSWARGTARPDSDIDLFILVKDESKFKKTDWLQGLDFERIGEQVESFRDEVYGRVWSRHVLFKSNLEIEFSFADKSWADTENLDDGTRKVVTDGFEVLYDPHLLLSNLATCVNKRFIRLRIDETLELHPINLDYAQEIFESFDSEIIRFLPLDNPPKKIEETIDFIEHAMAQMNKGHDLVWVILHNYEFAGCCGIHTLKTKQPHFGLWIKHEQQGKGIGKRVVHFMLPWGISNLDVEFIKYPVDRANTSSIRLIKDMNLILDDQNEMGDQKKLQVDEYRLYKE